VVIHDREPHHQQRVRDRREVRGDHRTAERRVALVRDARREDKEEPAPVAARREDRERQHQQVRDEEREPEIERPQAPVPEPENEPGDQRLRLEDARDREPARPRQPRQHEPVVHEHREGEEREPDRPHARDLDRVEPCLARLARERRLDRVELDRVERRLAKDRAQRGASRARMLTVRLTG
jgi:hypothetical protein